MMTDSRAITARLMREGCTIVRVRGSRQMFKRADTPLTVVVPHPARDLPIGMVRDIYRKAGWRPD